MNDPQPVPPTSDSAPLAYEPREAAASEALPRQAMALAVAPILAAVAATAGFVLTDSDALATIALFVAAGAVGCIIASAALLSMWMDRARRAGVPDGELWYRRRRVSLAMIVNLPVAIACIAIGNFWASSVVLTVTNVGTTSVQDVQIEFVGAEKSFGNLSPGQSRSRRFFPGDGGLAARWKCEGKLYTRKLEGRAEFRTRTILVDGDLAYGK